MISTQYVAGLHPGVRSNADLAFTFTQKALRQREALVDEYFGKLSVGPGVGCMGRGVAC